MRVIALVSLALALAASSMPLSTRADGGVPTTSTGTLGAVGSGLGNVVNPPGSGTAPASSLENGSLEPSTTSGNESGGGVYQSGSSTTSGLGSGSINPTRRSTTSGSSIPGDVTGALSQPGGEITSALGGTTSTSSIPGDVTGAVSQLGGEVASTAGTSSTSNPITRDTLHSRADASSVSGAGQLVGTVSEVAGAAAGQPGGAENGAEGTVGGAVSGAAGSLGKSG